MVSDLRHAENQAVVQDASTGINVAAAPDLVMQLMEAMLPVGSLTIILRTELELGNQCTRRVATN